MANRRKTRAYNLTDAEAARLQASIRGHGDFDPVTVRAQRGYLVVASGGDAWPVARLTPLGASQYGLSFHRHNGQWQPMPSSGNLDDLADTVVTMRAPFLERLDYYRPITGSDH